MREEYPLFKLLTKGVSLFLFIASIPLLNAEAKDYNIKEVDITPPAPVSFSPVDNSTDVAINSEFSVTFDEPIFADANETVAVFFKDGAMAFYFTESEVDFTDNVLTITLASDLDLNTNYNIELTNIKDAAGNIFHSDGSNTMWNFTTEVTPNVAPTLLSSSVADGSTYNNAIFTITLTFDEDINVNYFTNNFILYREQSGTNINLNSSITEVGADYVTITCDGLSQGENYAIKIDPGAVEDLEGLAYPGISDITTLNFSVLWDEPVLTSRYPEQNATGIAIDADFTLTFDENVVASPKASGGIYDIRLMKYSGSVVIEDVYLSDSEVSIVDNVLTYNPSVVLENSTLYRVIVSPSIVESATTPGERWSGLFDASGDESWYFTTEAGDVTPPEVSNTYPAFGGTYADLSGACNITFNEDVQFGSGTVSLYKSDNTLVESVPVGTGDPRVTMHASYRPKVVFDAGFEEATNYYIVVTDGAFEDLAGNAFAGYAANEWHFTSNARPHISSTTPTDNATDVALDADLEITFDTNVDSYDYSNANSNIYIYNYDTDALIETISTTAMSFNNNVVTINPVSDLPEGTHVYILDDADGSFVSIANSEVFDGLDSKDDWDFTTIVPDNDPPTVSTLNPVDNATGVAIDADLVITFNEEVLQFRQRFLLEHITRLGICSSKNL